MTDGMVGRLGEAPDLMEPVAGYRSFLLHRDGKLTSPYFCGVTWFTPKMKAECRADNVPAPSIRGVPMTGRKYKIDPCKDAPGHDHECGLYAYYDVEYALKRVQPASAAAKVLGIVTCWGRIEVHQHGMRAEWCEIKALTLYPYPAATWQPPVFHEMAERLGVLTLHPSLVAGTACEFASPMPTQLRPHEGGTA